MTKVFASGESARSLYCLVWMCNGGTLLLHWGVHLTVRGVDFTHLLSIVFSIQVFAI